MCGEGASPTWTETPQDRLQASVRTLRCMCVCTTCNGLRFDVVITRSCHQKAPSHMKSSAARAPSSSKWRKHVSQRSAQPAAYENQWSAVATCSGRSVRMSVRIRWDAVLEHGPAALPPTEVYTDGSASGGRAGNHDCEFRVPNLAGAWSAQPVPVSDWSHSNGWLSSPLAREDEKGLEDRKVKSGRSVLLCHGPSYT